MGKKCFVFIFIKKQKRKLLEDRKMGGGGDIKTKALKRNKEIFRHYRADRCKSCCICHNTGPVINC